MKIQSVEHKTERVANQDKNYWRELISAWQNSNQSQKEFCARMNVKLGTFAHWRGVFTKENRRNEDKFIGLQIVSSAQEKENYFTIECPSGHIMVKCRL